MVLFFGYTILGSNENRLKVEVGWYLKIRKTLENNMPEYWTQVDNLTSFATLYLV